MTFKSRLDPQTSWFGQTLRNLFQNPLQGSENAVQRYKNQMIPRARQAYEMYMKKYHDMAAAYPQVLIAQRTLMQLEVAYITSLETLATSSITLQFYLLTDGLEAPTQPGEIDRPVREVNMPFQPGSNQ